MRLKSKDVRKTGKHLLSLETWCCEEQTLTSSVLASVIILLSLTGSWMCLLRPLVSRGRTLQNTRILPCVGDKKKKRTITDGVTFLPFYLNTEKLDFIDLFIVSFPPVFFHIV